MFLPLLCFSPLSWSAPSLASSPSFSPSSFLPSSFLPSSPTMYVPSSSPSGLLAVLLVLGVLVLLGAGRLLPVLLLHGAAGDPSGVREQGPRLLGVLLAERAAAVGVGGLAGQREVAAHGLGGQAERLQHRLGQLPAVQGAGHGPADALVGEGAVGAVEGELGVGGLQRLADLEAAQGPLTAPGLRLGLAPLLAGERLLLGGLLVGAVGEGPGAQRLGGGPALRAGGRGAAGAHERGAGGGVAGPGGQADLVGGLRVDLGEVELARDQFGDPLVARDGAQHDPVQLRRLAPPARVAGEDDLVALGVDLLDREGSRGDLERPPGAVVEGVGGARDVLRVQRREQGLPVGVGPAEGDLDLQVVRAALDLLDAVVTGVAGGPVGAVLAGQGAPLGGEVRGADLPAVAPDGLLVQLVDDDLLGLGVDDLGRFQVVGVAHRAAGLVRPVHRGQYGLRDAGRGGVGVRLEGVQRVRHGVHRPAQGAAVGDPGAGRGGDVLLGERLARRVLGGASGQRGDREDTRGEEGDRTHDRARSDADVGHLCYLRKAAFARFAVFKLIICIRTGMRPLKGKRFGDAGRHGDDVA
ncbi:hypothetical protein RKD33_005099 [Streptomyces sp. SAI-129]